MPAVTHQRPSPPVCLRDETSAVDNRLLTGLVATGGGGNPTYSAGLASSVVFVGAAWGYRVWVDGRQI